MSYRVSVKQRCGVLVRSFVALFVAFAIAVIPALGANAAGTVLVSSDGVTFGSTYSGVLFNSIAKIVPGDSQSEVFYVRNSGPDDGYLRLTLRDLTGDPTLTAGLTVSAAIPAQAGSTVVLNKAAPCWVLNEGIFLAAGSTVAVTSTLVFTSAAGNPTQNSTADFNIGVSLTDTAVALAPTNCGGSSTPIPGTVPKAGVLSYTGSELPVLPISVGAFITGVGLFLIVAARRRKREQEDQSLSA